MDMTAYLLISTFRSDKYCEWIVNKYVIFFVNDSMMLGNESTRNKINKLKQYYIVVLILHSFLLSMWYVLFITKWDIRKRENFFQILHSHHLFIMEPNLVDFVSSWKCLTYNLGLFHIWLYYNLKRMIRYSVQFHCNVCPTFIICNTVWYIRYVKLKKYKKFIDSC